jgi:hypothetical protein
MKKNKTVIFKILKVIWWFTINESKATKVCGDPFFINLVNHNYLPRLEFRKTDNKGVPKKANKGRYNYKILRKPRG